MEGKGVDLWPMGGSWNKNDKVNISGSGIANQATTKEMEQYVISENQ